MWKQANVHKLILLFILWTLAVPALSEPTSPFKSVQMEISVFDRFQRPFVAPPESISLGVRLAQGEAQKCEAVAKYEQLASAGTEYPKQSDDYLRFPVENGVAKPQFVIFADTGKDAVDYELVLFIKEKKDSSTVKVPLNPSLWKIGVNSQRGETATDIRAPHSQDEVFIIAGIVVAGLIFSYLLFGKLGFSRFLHNSRMEVSTALGWSNLLVLFSWLALFVCTSALIFFPIIVWEKTYWIYLLVGGGYFGLLFLIYLLCLAFTRR